MPRDKNSFSNRMFRLLLRLFPADFRGDYGREMQDVFEEQRRDAQKSGGPMGMLKLWWETISGIFRTAPGEHWTMLKQDVSYGFRMLTRNPMFATLAILTLALGIGANTAIFSVVRSVLLRPLPYRNGGQIVLVEQHVPGIADGNMPFSVSELNDYRQAKSFSELAEYHGMSFILLGKERADRVKTGVVSSHFFDMLGIQPILGRDFTPADDQLGAPPVLLLSYEYWQRNQHGDPNIVGKTFVMNDKEHTVIGVLPKFPQFPSDNDVYMPVSACPFRSRPAFIANRDNRMMSAFARLNPGVTVEQAQAEVSTIAARLRDAYPKSYPARANYNATDTALKLRLTKEASPTLILLFVTAAFVLLIACANVANLTLSRMAKRERELALRAALGAGQSRVLRQLVTEGMLVAIPAAILGLAFASGSLKLLTEFAARLTPRAREIRMDGEVLAFAIGAAVLTSVVFGSLAAFRSRNNVITDLKESANQSASAGARGTHRALIVVQVAFSYIVLIGAGLALRTFYNLEQVDLGFHPERVLAMRLDVNWSPLMKLFQKDPKLANEYALNLNRRLSERLGREPGLVSYSFSSGFPLSPDSIKGGPNINTFEIQSRPSAPGDPQPISTLRAVGPSYFDMLGIPLLRGRYFSQSDTETSLQVAVVNQDLQAKYFKDIDPIGQKVSSDNGQTWQTIIGVVGNIHDLGAALPTAGEIYVPLEQNPSYGAVMVKTSGDPRLVEGQVRQAIHDVDPEIAVSGVITLSEARSESVASPRVTAELLAIFGGLALIIAVAGIFGVLALGVSQRVREIGIRMAMGAAPGSILRMIMSEGLIMVAIGLAVGCAGALVLTRLIQTVLFRVTPTDPLTFIAVAMLFLGAAAAACYLPARRATTIDPLQALRSE